MGAFPFVTDPLEIYELEKMRIAPEISWAFEEAINHFDMPGVS